MSEEGSHAVIAQALVVSGGATHCRGRLGHPPIARQINQIPAVIDQEVVDADCLACRHI